MIAWLVQQETISACCSFLGLHLVDDVVNPTFACDNVQWIQDFLHARRGCPLVYGNIDDMCHTSAMDVVSQSCQVVPDCILNSTGWVCVDVASTNMNRSKHTKCVETREGQSGATFDGYQQYLRTHVPLFTIGENVRLACLQSCFFVPL